MQAIKTTALVKRYKNLTAVDGLDLEIQHGELFSLLGVNGAGKTTAIKMLSCLTMPTAGDAEVGGYSVTKEPDQVKRLIGVSPQETAVAPNLSVKENLELICGIHGFSREKTIARVKELSRQFDLDSVLQRKAGKLSGGWQNNRQMGMHEEYRYAENIFEELTEPGEWFYDEKRHRIFVIPCPGDDLTSAEIAVSHGFFVLDGAQNVRIENLTFSRSSRTFMQTREPLLRSDWTIFRGGAVMLQDSHNCMIDRCTFSDIGSNAVFVSGSADRP